MYPQHSLSNRKLLFFAAAVILLIFICLVGLETHQRHGVEDQRQIIGLDGQAKTVKYADPAGAYSFSYPSSWKVSPSQASSVAVLTYTVNGAAYQFTVSPPGQINPEAILNLTSDRETVLYGTTGYTRTVWSTNGEPFYITAVPQTGAQVYYVMTMYIPPNNTQDYITAFDKIGQTLQY